MWEEVLSIFEECKAKIKEACRKPFLQYISFLLLILSKENWDGKIVLSIKKSIIDTWKEIKNHYPK